MVGKLLREKVRRYDVPCTKTPHKNGEKSLHLATRSNEVDIVRRLLKLRADVNAQDNDGRTPMHLAVEANAKAVLWILLHHRGTNLNACMKNGDTPLIIASRTEKESCVVQGLINAGADVNQANIITGKTALHCAAECGCKAVVDVLLENGAKLNVKDEDGHTPLYCAILFKRDHIAEMLLEAGADSNIQNNRGHMPLLSAMDTGNTNIVRTLLHHGANPNTSTRNGRTPLITAVHFGMDVAVRELIIAGADMDVAYNSGMTALHWTTDFTTFLGSNRLINRWKELGEAVSFSIQPSRKLLTGRAKAAKHLLDAGANANLRDHHGLTPLHAAVQKKINTVFKILVNHKTSLNIGRPDGRTPLMTAVITGMKFMVKNLINAGADVDAADKSGMTALHYAADFSDIDYEDDEDDEACELCCSREDAAHKLLDAGANANLRDNAGLTPLHIAVESEAWDVCNILMRHSATDVNAHRMSDGKTALMMLLEFNNPSYIDGSGVIWSLIEAGADVNAVDDEGKTVLHHASEKGEILYMRIYYDLGAKVDVQDNRGQTPLFIAARNGRFNACETLVAVLFANRDIADKKGRLPVDVARQRHYQNIVRLLTANMSAG